MTPTNLDHFVTMRSAVARAAAMARFEQEGRRTSLAGAEDTEQMMAGGDIAESAPMQFHLLYEDDAGSRSQRIVTVRAIERHGADAMLRCFCHLRRAPRSFVTSRIQEVFDANTGEVHTDATTFFLHHPLLTAPANPEDHAVRHCKDELIILVVVAACDGVLHPDEEDRLVTHVFDRSPDLLLEEQAVRRHISSLAPDEGSFQAALNRVARRPEVAKSLVRALRKLVDADGRLHPEEVGAVISIQQHLGIAA